ncbi:unnamed protein product [Hydatigera taeniaeformis]|uniref:Uncharacterized protein n=1 Tax=Hydatigena taeniaeformis TaxID=6205 RepID=A0A0R3XBD9_HYDTA|nr:unnamed protein product [Hydatigera taeniaeformis]
MEEEEELMQRMDENGPLHDKRRTQQRRGGRWRRVLTTLVATMCGRSRQTQHHRRRRHRHRFTDSGLTLL